VSLGTSYFYVVKATDGRRASAPTDQAQAGTPLACLF
jgi:hypothetical protein